MNPVDITNAAAVEHEHEENLKALFDVAVQSHWIAAEKIAESEKLQERYLQLLKRHDSLRQQIAHFYRDMGDSLAEAARHAVNSSDNILQIALTEIAYNSQAHDDVVDYLQDDNTIQSWIDEAAQEYAEEICGDCDLLDRWGREVGRIARGVEERLHELMTVCEEPWNIA